MSDVSKREEIDKALRCLYIAVDECVARDVGKIFLAYAEDVEARLAEVERERESVRKELVRAMDAACNSGPEKSDLRMLVMLLSDIDSVVAVITKKSEPTKEPTE